MAGIAVLPAAPPALVLGLLDVPAPNTACSAARAAEFRSSEAGLVEGMESDAGTAVCSDSCFGPRRPATSFPKSDAARLAKEDCTLFFLLSSSAESVKDFAGIASRPGLELAGGADGADGADGAGRAGGAVGSGGAVAGTGGAGGPGIDCRWPGIPEPPATI